MHVSGTILTCTCWACVLLDCMHGIRQPCVLDAMFIGWRSHRKWGIAEGRFLQDPQKIKFCEFLYFLHAHQDDLFFKKLRLCDAVAAACDAVANRLNRALWWVRCQIWALAGPQNMSVTLWYAGRAHRPLKSLPILLQGAVCSQHQYRWSTAPTCVRCVQNGRSWRSTAR